MSSNLASSSSTPVGANVAARPHKRRKTQRACNYCKEHKLRCAMEDGIRNEDDGRLICKHCADFGIECIVSAPSGDKRRAQQDSRLRGGIGSSDSAYSTPNALSDAITGLLNSSNGIQLDNRVLDDPRYSGESSLSALVSHFVLIIRGREQQADSIYQSLNTDRARPTGTDNFLLLQQTRYPPPLNGTESKFVNARIDRTTVKLLVDQYLTFIQPLNSVVSRAEVFNAFDLSNDEVHIASLSPLGFAILCLSAMYRNAPRYAREALLFHQRYRSFAVFRSSVETVQSLLLLCLSVEMMAPDTNDAAGMCLNALGLAIRMAHDLGMHRDMSRLGVSPARNRRMARIWSALVIQDRWYSLCFGQPNLIHLDDCDALPPSIYDDEQDPALATPSTPRPYLMHVVHYKVAILVGRTHKLGFGPRGLKPSAHQEIREIIKDIEEWQGALPSHLIYTGRRSGDLESTIESGWLFSMRVTIDFLLYRIALNLGPEHTPFDRHETWNHLVRRSSEALEWLSSQDGLHCLDCYSITLYFLVQCSIVQYYSACQGGSLHGLRVARQSMQNRGTVATAATSRSQLYDPYGPDDKDRQAPPPTQTPSSANGNGNGTAAHNGSSGRSSPTPESNNGNPTLLRLRVKISSLLSMLLEIAEHRRAAVLNQRHEQFEASRKSVSGAGAGAPLHEMAASTAAGGGSVEGSGRPQDASHVPRHASQLPPHAYNGSYGNNVHVGGVVAHHDVVATSSPRSVQSAMSVGTHPSGSALYGSSPQIAYGGQTQAAEGIAAAAMSNMRSQPPSTTTAISSFPHHPSSSSSMGLASSPSTTSKYVNGMTSALGPHPPALVPPFVPPTYQSLTNGGGGGEGAQSFILSPRSVEDLDLMTIQRWADAVLCEPTSSIEAQQQQQPMQLYPPSYLPQQHHQPQVQQPLFQHMQQLPSRQQQQQQQQQQHAQQYSKQQRSTILRSYDG